MRPSATLLVPSLRKHLHASRKTGSFFLVRPCPFLHFLAFLVTIPFLVTVGRGDYFTGGLFLAPEREKERWGQTGPDWRERKRRKTEAKKKTQLPQLQVTFLFFIHCKYTMPNFSYYQNQSADATTVDTLVLYEPRSAPCRSTQWTGCNNKKKMEKKKGYLSAPPANSLCVCSRMRTTYKAVWGRIHTALRKQARHRSQRQFLCESISFFF